MTDRVFWLTVRRGLLTIAKAIEVRYLGKAPHGEELADLPGMRRVIRETPGPPPRPGEVAARYDAANTLHR